MTQERRTYRSPRREEQARATRQRLLTAARQRFAERGWGATTLRSIADDAGVAEPTVYAVFGSKAGLAMALVDLVDEAADVRTLLAVLENPTSTVAEQLRAAVDFEARIGRDAGDLVRLLRDGSAHDPELRAAYADGLERGRSGFRRMAATWPAGTLRDGVTVEWAADVYSAITTVDPYDTLVGFGWTTEQISDWWYRALASTLLSG